MCPSALVVVLHLEIILLTLNIDMITLTPTTEKRREMMVQVGGCETDLYFGRLYYSLP